MIAPTGRAIGLMALGAPLGIACGMVAPDAWVAGLAWILFAAGLVGGDALLGQRGRPVVELDAPAALQAGGAGTATVRLRFRGPAPRRVELALECSPLLACTPESLTLPGSAPADFHLVPARRGTVRLVRLWLRWHGPLRLVWRQQVHALDRAIAVIPHVAAVTRTAIRLRARTAQAGTAVQPELGETQEFHALKAFAGDDPRRIHWRQSARHGRLLAIETRAERNRGIVLAIDAGRLMCETLDGLPRLDHAINAALHLAYAALREGDQVGVFAFDEVPRAAALAQSGPAAFAGVQRLLAGIDYSTAETNFTLALATLAGQLRRRSLIVLFTDFADMTGAELMLEHVAGLLGRHVVLFVAFHDAELEALAAAPPATAEAIARAVVAAALLRERELVIARLHQLGIDILQAPARAAGGALIGRYLAVRQHDRL
jgi:uncharacterized protein (DUF58 family)